MKIKCPNCSQNIDLNSKLFSEINKDKIKKMEIGLYHEFEEKFLNASKEIRENAKKEISELTAKNKKYNEKIMSIEDELAIFKLNQEGLLEKEKKSLSYKMKNEFNSYKRKIDERHSELLKEREEINENLLKEKDIIIDKLVKEAKNASTNLIYSNSHSSTIGEAGEKNLLEKLEEAFPNDFFEEIKNGVRGADILQKVNNSRNDTIGIIYYESKNAKQYRASWVDKFKEDMEKKDCHVGILVTKTMPTNAINDFIFCDGIYITTQRFANQIAMILRRAILDGFEKNKIIENKQSLEGDVYNYINSKDFSNKITNLITLHNDQREMINKEKQQTEKWFQIRLKQIDQYLNTVNLIMAKLEAIQYIENDSHSITNPIKEAS
jgi:hypothetical protein